MSDLTTERIAEIRAAVVAEPLWCDAWVGLVPADIIALCHLALRGLACSGQHWDMTDDGLIRHWDGSTTPPTLVRSLDELD